MLKKQRKERKNRWGIESILHVIHVQEFNIWCYLRFQLQKQSRTFIPTDSSELIMIFPKGFYLTQIISFWRWRLLGELVFERPIKCSRAEPMAAEFGLSDVMDEYRKILVRGYQMLDPELDFSHECFPKNLIHEARLILSNTNIWNKNHRQWQVGGSLFLAKWPFLLSLW